MPVPSNLTDLVWLLHLVGDVHQPLHCATRVSKGNPDGDAGGNAVVFCKPGAASCNGELHAFWDDVLSTSKSGASARAFAMTLTVPSIAASDIADIGKWIDASFGLAKTRVYIPPVMQGNGPFTATTKYANDAKGLATDQVALTGARLAAIIKADLK